MNFIYNTIKTGNSADKIAIGSLFVASSALIVTLIIFFGGIFYNNRLSKKQIWREVNLVKELFSNWVQFSKVRTVNQAKNIEEFANKIYSNVLITPITIVIEPLLFEKLNELPTEKVFNALVINLKDPGNVQLNRFTILVCQIDFLTKLESIIFKEYENYFDLLNQLTLRYNFAYTKSIEMIFSGSLKAQKDLFQFEIDKFFHLIELREIWLAKLIDKNPSADDFFLLVDTWLEFYDSDGNNFLNQSTLDHYSLLDNLKSIQREWMSYKLSFHNTFLKNAEKLVTSHEVIYKAAIELSNLKSKSICRMV